MSKTMIYPLILAALLGYVFSLFIGAMPAVQQSGAVLIQYQWVPSLEMPFAFRLDGLSLLFSLLISGIGTLIFIYSAAYMKNYARTPYFFTVLFLFALSMLGLVLADHFMVLFIFWELTAITSYLLIGYNNTSHIARRNALQALLVTGGGGLVLFVGLVLLGVASSHFSLTGLLADPGAITEHPLVNAVFICIFIGCITKSAQIPFHFWLPNAMAAPTPVSAYLHSATMVKAGIYLLARFQPVFGELELWMPLLATLGGVTAVWASMLAVTQSDLKQMLAYTTLMALGTLTFLLAFPGEMMAVALMVFLVVHALYKAALFMIVGIIDQATGTRQVDMLSGLKTGMPHVWLFALLAGLSMAGIPPLFGFISKEMQYEAALGLPYSGLVIGVLMAANALMFIAAYMVAIRPFKGKASEAVKKFDGKLSAFLWLPPALLASLGLSFGLVPATAYTGLIDIAANAVANATTNVVPALWHGVNTALILSLATFSLGVLGIMRFEQLKGLCWQLSNRLPSIEAIYFKKLRYLQCSSLMVTRTLHHGSLERYVRLTIGVVFGSILIVISQHYPFAALVPSLPALPNWIGVALSVLAVSGAFYAIRATTKIMALASLGASGFAMAGIFLLHGALDVAITQLLVETLFVILTAALLWRVPETSLKKKCIEDSRTLNIGIAVIAGVTSMFVMMVVLKQPLDTSLTYFFEHASYTMAHGRNIVNVILVDFRAFDTFGEVLVVAVAALGLWGLTQRLEKTEEDA